MEVDFSVELGPDDPTLHLPWSDPDSQLHYHDLKRDPLSLASISEAQAFPALHDLLSRINSPASLLESAKCDVWSTTELDAEEEIFDAPWKFAAYVDLLFADSTVRKSFSHHEEFLKALAASLKSATPALASIEFILRRCYDDREGTLHEGFYVTTYVFGYGADKSEARDNCSAALAHVSRALLDRSSPTKTQHPAL